MATYPVRYLPRWATGEAMVPGDAATGPAIGAGAVSGIIAGLAMAMFAMGRALFMGEEIWSPVRAIAATFYGNAALTMGFEPVIVGLLMHVAASAVLGAIFAVFVGARFMAGTALFYGLVWGVIIWAVMTFLVLPWLNPVMSAMLEGQPFAWFFEHLIFGAVLGMTPPLARSFAGAPRVTIGREPTRPATPPPPPPPPQDVRGPDIR